MKWIKGCATALLSLCLACSLAGCTKGSKNAWIDGWNNFMQSFSRNALTTNLQGSKTEGEDAYTGSYNADYKEFNGNEYIFGGTGLYRKDGGALKATYTLRIAGGEAVLYWLDKGEKKIIADKTGRGEYNFTIHSGDNYIILDANQFTRKLELTIE